MSEDIKARDELGGESIGGLISRTEKQTREMGCILPMKIALCSEVSAAVELIRSPDGGFVRSTPTITSPGQLLALMDHTVSASSLYRSGTPLCSRLRTNS